jgi:oxalate---CoA ligase
VSPRNMSADDSGARLALLSQELCIPRILRAQAEQHPAGIALLGLGGPPLTYHRLLTRIKTIGATLNAIGIRRNDRVAVVLPAGSEVAVAILAVTCCATCAPLNPAYSSDEFESYFADLDVKALIVQGSSESPARAIAQKLGVSILEIEPLRGPADGVLGITANESVAVQDTCARPEDVALVLHTSGTTSRPKIVPLTQANLSTSASNIGLALGLTMRDRCLNMMPLFHIHGLMVTLASLWAGASVCPVRFEPRSIFTCIDTVAPTWYTAVPTMHQAILRMSEANQDIIKRSGLRFIRSSSAPLPPRVMVELEEVFRVPVIESYGMTEASHQIASNPLPPGVRKTGSVGVPVGVKVAIMDDAGTLRSSGETGEIVLRGDNILAGYEKNPEANANAFSNGWFRTGDQGFLDSEGYLFITGRLKDVINRGGEKVSPAEVDRILVSHPAVEQAVTFPVPHPTLGEDVATAVVLQKNASTAPQDIRKFVSERLVDFKVPSRILIVAEIPKGSTGKLQRGRMAAELGVGPASSVEGALANAPRDLFELTLTNLWEKVLGVHPIGVRNNFFELGGDSLLATELLVHIENAWGTELPLRTVYTAPTIEQLAVVLREREGAATQEHLIPLKPGGCKPPFFCVYGAHHIASHMDAERPFYALEPPGHDGRRAPTNVEDMADGYIKEIQVFRPEGPYLLGGYSLGAVIAFEMAQQLRKQGHEVALLVLLEPAIPKMGTVASWGRAEMCRGRGGRYTRILTQLRMKKTLRHVVMDVRAKFADVRKEIGCQIYLSMGRRIPFHLRMSYYSTVSRQALRRYVAQEYAGRVALLLAEESADIRARELVWTKLASAELTVHRLPGGHFNIGEEPRAKAWAEQVSSDLNDVEAR